jgi:hypothetical protein
LTKYRCLNCPDKPVFLDFDHFKTHWNATHTVPMEGTIQLPPELAGFFPEVQTKTRKLYEEIA